VFCLDPSGVLFPVPSFGVRRRLCSVCVVPDLRNVYVLRSSISQCAALISSQRSQQDFPAQLIFPAPVDSLCSRFLPPPLNLRGYSCFVIQHGRSSFSLCAGPPVILVFASIAEYGCSSFSRYRSNLGAQLPLRFLRPDLDCATRLARPRALAAVCS
jgi:hypothetical protein